MPGRDRKLCIIGGGGVRTPFVAKTIATHAANAGIAQLVLFDLDGVKLNTYGQIAAEIATRIDPNLKVTLTDDAREALMNCDYIITTVRVGGDSARREDEQIAAKYGLLAQETTGACGFAMAMRSIPILINYCQIANEVARPGYLVFNFTNPAGIVTQALRDLGFPAVGICDSPMELIRQLADMLEVPEREFTCNSFGLNHLSWFNKFKVKGTDVSTQVLNHPKLFEKTEMRLFKKDIMDQFPGYLLNEYLYFYYYQSKAIKLTDYSDLTRAELIKKVNQKMSNELAQINIKDNFDEAIKIFFDNYNVRENSYLKIESGIDRVKNYSTPTATEFISSPDSGGYAGVAMRLISALQGDEQIDMVLSVPNQGAIAELEPTDVIEVSCKISQGEILPTQQENIPDTILNLVLSIKNYERLALSAILARDKQLAISALMAHPLIADKQIAENLVEDFILAYGHYAGVWK